MPALHLRSLCFIAGIMMMPFVNAALGQDPQPAAPPAPDKPAGDRVKIVLKLDDVTSASPAWKRVFAFLKEKNVKCGAGIICKSLDGDKKPYYAWLKEVNDTGLVEFWNHGWDHAQWKEGEVSLQEFKGPSYEQQKEHYTNSQKIVKEKLGITMRSFGAPFNATDDNTLKVLAEDPDTRVFMYGPTAKASEVPNVLILARTQMNIENPLFLPNPDRIKTDYAKLKGKHDVFVIQGHPGNWTDERFENFKKLVEYLISENVIFMTPYEYYQSKQGAAVSSNAPATK